MGLFSFLRREKAIKCMEVPIIGKLNYHVSKIGSTFYTYIDNEKIKQKYELYIYSDTQATPIKQLNYYNDIIENWVNLTDQIKKKLQHEKDIVPRYLSMNIIGINDEERDSLGAALAFFCDEMSFTAVLRDLKIKEIEYI